METNVRDTFPTSDKLDDMSAAELREAFLALNIGHIPKNASSNFLRSNLAWASQAIQVGFQPSGLRKDLLKTISKATKPSATLYKPGTRLVREWQGVTHEVTIEEEGFSWNGGRYRSLSQVAGQITGTRWSGPRFFGLKGASND